MYPVLEKKFCNRYCLELISIQNVISIDFFYQSISFLFIFIPEKSIICNSLKSSLCYVCSLWCNEAKMNEKSSTFFLYARCCCVHVCDGAEIEEKELNEVKQKEAMKVLFIKSFSSTFFSYRKSFFSVASQFCGE